MKHITIPSSILSKCVTCIREKCPGTTTITIMYTDLLLFFLSLFLFHITNACKEELNHQLNPFQWKAETIKLSHANQAIKIPTEGLNGDEGLFKGN